MKTFTAFITFFYLSLASNLAFGDSFAAGASVYNYTSDTDSINFNVSDFCLGGSGDISRAAQVFHYRTNICTGEHLIGVNNGYDGICNFIATLTNWPGIVVTGSKNNYECKCTGCSSQGK